MDLKRNRQIRKARPSLKAVSPMSYWFIFLMGCFNLILGMALILIFDGINDPILGIVTAIIPACVWGVLFFLLGIAKLVSLQLNRWKWSRRSLLVGVTLKSSWIIALIVKTVLLTNNIFITLCWITIAVTQILCYIYFLPPQEMELFNGHKNGK